VKHIKDVLYEMYEEDGYLDQQTTWLIEYKIDPIKLGRMCKKYPALQTSWEQFKLMYDIARSHDDTDKQVS
jgi:hypothetical protein